MEILIIIIIALAGFYILIKVGICWAKIDEEIDNQFNNNLKQKQNESTK